MLENKAQNGFDLPIEKQEVLRFSNRHYCENLEKALSHDETDHSEDFLLKLESSVRERIQKSVSDRKNIQPEKVCIFKGRKKFCLFNSHLHWSIKDYSIFILLPLDIRCIEIYPYMYICPYTPFG